jgi:predicted permease
MSLWNDVRLAVRMLVRDRTFALTAIAALAVGIAANTMVFALVNGVLLRDLPYAEPGRLVALESREIADNDTSNMSYADLLDLRASTKALRGIAGVSQGSITVADGSGPAERLIGASVSANAFSLLGHRPAVGRDFRADDDRVGAQSVAILGHALWQRRYGTDPGILGRSIRVNGTPTTVVGVMPEGFKFPETAEIWQPLALIAADVRDRRNRRSIDGIARLADGATIDQARTETNIAMAGLAREYPDTNAGIAADVLPYRDAVTGGRAVEAFSTLMAAVAFLLVMACANVANLLLARSEGRAREMSIRASIGSSRWRIVRQLLVESLVLAVVAGTIGLALAAGGVRLFDRAFAAADPPFWLAFPIDGRVIGFVVAAGFGTTILFGLMPALQAAPIDLTGVLNAASRTSAGSVRGRRWTGTLVVVQVALALVLVSGGALIVRGGLAHLHRNAGVDTSGLVAMRIEPRLGTNDARTAFYRQLDDRLSALPGMRAAIATPAPRMGGPELAMSIEGRPAPDGRRLPRVTTVATGRRYFDALAIAATDGRLFDDADGAGNRSVVIVNQRFQERFFPGGRALGQQIRLGLEGPDKPPTGALSIVGVVPNVRQNDEEEDAFDAVAYLPYAADPLPNAMILVRSDLGLAAIAGSLRALVSELDADLPLFEISTLDDTMAAERWPLRLFGSLYGAFAISALVLAALGLYAVTAYAASRRTRELGVRVALGARPVDICWTVTRRVAIQFGIGATIGVAGTFGLGQVLESILAGVSGRDPATLTMVPLLLAAVALAACLIPARRAMRVNPVDALRSE